MSAQVHPHHLTQKEGLETQLWFDKLTCYFFENKGNKNINNIRT